jgi:hypothetical protein
MRSTEFRGSALGDDHPDSMSRDEQGPKYPSRMPRRVSLWRGRLGPAAALVLLMAVACTVPSAPKALKGQGGDSIRGITGDLPGSLGTQAEPAAGGITGVYLLGVITPPVFVFGPYTRDVQVQPGTTSLMHTLAPSTSKTLKVFALPSPEGTSAVAIRELSKSPARWGVLSTPAQRMVYRAFAADHSMGDWLVMVTDVEVLDGTDPVPLTAYRWPRSAVETYAHCGIPPVGEGIPWGKIDACTDQFFMHSETVLVRPRSNQVGQ